MRIVKHTFVAIATIWIVGCATETIPTPEVKPTTVMPVSPLVKHIIFFEFDSSLLPDNADDIMTPHVRYLIQNPNQKVLIEGFADEAGTERYNFELGLKRANAVKDGMVSKGISEEQLLIASRGEQRLLNHENKQHSQARNRRVDFIY